MDTKDINEFNGAYIEKTGDPLTPYVFHYADADSNISFLRALSMEWAKDKEITLKRVLGLPSIINYLIDTDSTKKYYTMDSSTMYGDRMTGILESWVTGESQLIVNVRDDKYLAFTVDISSSESPSDKPDNYGHNAIEPDHYKNGDHDLLWHLKDILTPEEFRGAMKFNIIKYTVRENNKNGIEDIEKGKEYLNRFEEFEKSLQNTNTD